MAAVFAALEARVNAAVLRRLSNAVARVDGEDVPVVFERPYAGPFDSAVDASAPSCTGPAAALGALERDDPIGIDGTQYEIVTAEPDGTGMVRLVLRTV